MDESLTFDSLLKVPKSALIPDLSVKSRYALPARERKEKLEGEAFFKLSQPLSRPRANSIQHIYAGEQLDKGMNTLTELNQEMAQGCGEIA